MSKRAIHRLSHLLRTERQALLAGDLEVVESLIEEKTSLANKLGTARGADLRSLKEALDHNARLISAAQEGVATVLATLKQQRDARSSLTSYDRSGKATQITQTSGGTERRF